MAKKPIKNGYTKKPKVDPDDPEVKQRKCLGENCGKMFRSTWSGNRLCPNCVPGRKQIVDTGDYRIIK